MAASAPSQWLPIAQIAEKVQEGSLKAADLIEQSLRTITEKKEYNAIISVIEMRARERAANIDATVKAGKKAGRLAGVPFIAKDMFLTLESQTTAASNMLREYQAPYQSVAIERLEAEGAICVAKANLDAFAHGVSTQNSDFFVTKNPHDKTRVPGGSSGGSTAAVVLDMAPFALGTDTGGSIRQPASFSGCIGYKPTYGLVSRSGVIAMASSTDTIGPVTRTIKDAALILDVMAGRDPLDSTTIDRDPEGYCDLFDEVKNKKIGVIKEHMGEGVAPEVKQVIESAIQKLKRAGVDIQEISLPSLPLSLGVYYIIVPAEISSNLSRYDGQRYGRSALEARNLEESYMLPRGFFGRENKRRIMIGTYVLSSGYYDAYYKQAQIVRTRLINEFNDAFSKVDFLVGPTAPTTAFKIGENADDPLQAYLADVMTVGASLAGIPGVNLPAGTSAGLPVGLQIMAPQRADRALLAFAQQAEELLA